MSERVGSWVFRVTILSILLAAFTVGGIFLLFRSSLPKLDGAVTLPGLENPVSVERDARGIPLLRGESREDVTRALGFLHAQERFFAMDLQRRAGVGRLAELFGERALDFDVERRRWSGPAMATAAFARMPAWQRRLLEVYAEGVNTGLAALKSRPPEYWLLGRQPEAWRPEDSLAVALAMYHTLQDGSGEFVLRRELLRRLLPEAVSSYLETLPEAFEAPLEGLVPEQPPLPVAEWVAFLDAWGSEDEEPVETAQHQIERPWSLIKRRHTAGVGSNAWAVAPNRTITGRAILAGDPHLGLAVPNIWYRASLTYLSEQGEPVEAHGVTLPGAPYVIIGSNRHVAWGLTNSNIAYLSLISLDVDPAHPDQYRTPDGREAFGTRREKIVVAGWADPFELLVETTRWGPVRRVAMPEGGEALFAVDWVAARDYGLGSGMLGIEEAKSVEEAMAVAHRSVMPTQNLILADRAGSIAWTLTGPVRGAPGSKPIDGATTASEADAAWRVPLSKPLIPRVVNPEGGHVASANQRKLRTAVGDLIGDSRYADDSRAARLVSQLETREDFDEKGFLELQLDTRALYFDPVVPALLGAIGKPESRELEDIRDALLDYDGFARSDSRGFLVLMRWQHHFRDVVVGHLFAPFLKAFPDLDFLDEPRAALLFALIEEQPEQLVPPGYDGWTDLQQSILARVAAEMADGATTWGEANQLQMFHPLGGIHPLVNRALGMPQTPQSGSSYSLRVQRPDFGDSMRLVVSPGYEEDGFLQMPGGQSGHFLSRYYREGHQKWVHGQPDALMPGETVHRLRLQP